MRSPFEAAVANPDASPLQRGGIESPKGTTRCSVRSSRSLPPNEATLHHPGSCLGEITCNALNKKRDPSARPLIKPLYLQVGAAGFSA